MTERLLLLDGHSLAFRSFFALPKDNFHTSAGQYTNAIHGFLSVLVKLYQEEEPTHVAVAFDLPGGTFRTRQYEEYKGGRAETPEEFKGQIPLIQEALDALGIPWLTKEDYEADDIIATLTTRGRAEGFEVIISSGDKDSYQLVSDHVTVLYPMPRSQMLRMTPDVVEERTGVRPERYSDIAALVGEKADNLPGVPGVGNKTAVKWINQYGDLETLLDHADEISGKVGESLRAHIDDVRRNRELNHLLTDLDIVDSLDELKPRGTQREAIHQLFDLLDFNQLRERVLSTFPSGDGDEESSFEDIAIEAITAREGDFAKVIDSGERLGLFIVGDGRPARGRVDTIAIGHGLTGYVSHVADLSEKDREALSAWLASDAEKVVHGAKAAWHAVRGTFGVELAGVSLDTELAAYLIHPDQRSYDLTDLLVRHTGFEPADLATGQIDILSEESFQGEADRACGVLRLATALSKTLGDNESLDVMTGLELPLVPVLAHMEDTGIAIDTDVLDRLSKDFDSRVSHAANSAYAAIGREVNLSSPKQLQVVLFEDLELPKTKKTKSGYTTNAEALNELYAKLAFREDDTAVKGREFLGQLLEHRDAIKLRQSVDGLLGAVQADGKIHTTFQQTVAATGRLSSIDPNLQNIHARNEEGQKIRDAFVPSDGYVSIMTADYSQIEMRIMAHESGDESLIEAFRDGEDLHSYVAGHVYQIPASQVSTAQRSKIKAMSYGLAYGLSAYGLSRQLGIDVREANELMDEYFVRFGRVRDYLENIVRQAVKDGYTHTMFGRRRYLPDLTSTNRQRREAAERMALNAPIQGTAADIIKIAMLDVDAALENLTSRVLLQVHDELVLEIAPGEEDQVRQIVVEKMANAVELSVPLEVGVGVGATWREAAH